MTDLPHERPSSDANSPADPPPATAPSSAARGGASGGAHGTKKIAELLSQIRESAELLARDHASRGDLKILTRTLHELRDAFRTFAPYRARRKVTVFGSARMPAERPAYRQAVAFGREMAGHDWLVITGASTGIMEAGHVGAGRTHSMGLNILLPFEQAANRIIAGDPKLVNMKYFFTRKLMFVKESDAICLLPGGFGTLDEGFEVLTLLQTGKHDMMPVVLLDEPGGDYWQTCQEFIRKGLLDRGMIDAHDLSLYRLTDRVDEAVDEIVGFYRVYHSMRYVRQNLVLRLNAPLEPARLEELNERFADLVVKGRMTLGGRLPEEKEETALAHLPRLIFQFNRHSYGRLRQMIDCLNGRGDSRPPDRR